MRSIFPWVAAILLGLAGSAQARDHAPAFPKGTAVLVVGEVTSPPKLRLGEQKLQVGIGPDRTDYTLHFFGAQLLGANGRPLDEGAFDRGMWVRAEGRIMNDSRRVKVDRLQVIASDRATAVRSALLPPGQEQGYIMSVAGTRQTFPETAATAGRAAPTVIVGKVGDDYRPLDLAPGFTLQAAGTDWRVAVPHDGRITDRRGGTVSPQALLPGHWVRVYGWRTDDLRVRVARIEHVGNDAALRRSGVSRVGSPLGYAESVDASGLERITLRGTVRKLDAEQGYLTLRDSDRREHRIWLPAAEITVPNRPTAHDYRIGDEVEASIVTFR